LTQSCASTLVKVMNVSGILGPTTHGRRVLKRIVPLAILLAAMHGSTGLAESRTHSLARAQQCRALWAGLPGVSGSGLQTETAVLMREWKKREKDCSGTGVYEVMLATIHFVDEDFDAALQALGSDVPADPDFRNRFNALKLELAFHRDRAHGALIPTLVARYEDRFKTLSASDASSCPAHEAAANFFMTVRKYGEALPYATKYVACEPGSWNGYRLLTILSALTSDYPKAAKYCADARARLPTLSDKDFMFACARGFAAVGDRETVQAIFVIVDAEDPNAKNLPEYRETVAFAVKALRR
jgi:hypothetical protein